MPQEYINAALGLLVSGVGWWLKTMWDDHRKLETKVAEIEVLVAGEYIKRSEVATILNRIDHKLDAISIKLDTKADK